MPTKITRQQEFVVASNKRRQKACWNCPIYVVKVLSDRVIRKKKRRLASANMLWTLLFIFWAVVPGLITGWMFRERGRRFTHGLLLGAASGPLGILGALVFIYISDCRHARAYVSKHGRAVRLFYDIPLVGRLHVSTVWGLAGLATFLCLWMVGGIVYEMQRGNQMLGNDERDSVTAVALQTKSLPTTASSTSNHADSKTATGDQTNSSSTPQSALLGSISAQTGQPAHGTSRAESSSTQSSQPVSSNSLEATKTISQPETVAPPNASPTVQVTSTPAPPVKPPAQSRESVVAEAARSLSSMGHNVHTSLSGEGRSTTLSFSGASLTREVGSRFLGNGRLRESLKSAGVRIVVMINGQESWTYIL